MKLQGKTALITGAAKRIGREIALTLASRGVAVMLHYHKSKRDAEKLKAKIESMGGKAAIVSANLSQAGQVKTLLRKVFQKTTRIDILVNNASVFYPTRPLKVTERQWEDFQNTNLKAPFFLAQELGKQMIKRKSGKIINLVDWVGQSPAPRFMPYAVSKEGLVVVTRGLAKMLAPHVQVLGIAPGPILPAKGLSRKHHRAVIQRTLLKRYGDPKDIAQTVRFFCEDTDFITGTIIDVDGGATIA